ncbi:transposase [Pseudomonas putida]|jgi:hypothetical protein|uniref:Transposase n=1 Tax=Rhodanobacter denitrificans TaxID=666685 RepID=A0A2W5M6J7_9GAMM|nr:MULTISPECIES: transposase [Pseudomonas]PZQ09030.1 MAG: transposase [Rhodanobacter denitrificans]MBI6940066.1 transposase [Pseudomonas putida]MBI6961340.1 transposase [Pseudomonas putida]MCZ9638566.1 transposase [Pseudomonas putida]QKL03850.1 transposase [Pseudomonas sp. NY5710]
MAAIDFPKGLPLPLQDSYSLNTIDPMARTQMVTGRARQRVRHSYVPTFVSAAFLFNQDQASLFEAWYARTLGNGVEWFNCPLQTAEGLRVYEARFTQIYEGPSLVQMAFWRYSVRLELRQRPLIPEGWENFPGLWLGKSIIDVAINREWPKA